MRPVLAAASILLLGAAVALGAPFAYVSGCIGVPLDCAQVRIVDTANDTVVGSVALTGPEGEGFPSRAVVVSASGTRAYVSSFYGNGVAVIDATTNAQIAMVATFGDGAFDGLAIDSAGTRVWQADEFGGLATIDATTNTLISVTDLGHLLEDVVAHPNGQRLYLTVSSPAGVLVVDTATLTPQTFLPSANPFQSPRGIAISPDGSRVYAGDTSGVVVIDTTTDAVLTTIPFPNAFTVAVHPAGSRVYATDGHGAVAVIDAATNTVTTTVAVGPPSIDLWGVTVHPDGTRVYVTSFDSAGMAILDTTSNTVVGTIPSGTASSAVATLPIVESDLKCDAGRVARGTTPFPQRTVSVVDDFETKGTSVTRPADMCTPSIGPGNMPSHRRCYRASDAKGQTPFATVTLTTTDRFGTHPLVVGRTGLLCLPQAGLPLDAMKCHKVRAKPKTFSRHVVSVTDDFETKTTEVLKPAFYCLSAGVDGGARRTPAARRTCYKIRDAAGQPKLVKQDAGLTDAFGTFTQTITKADLLCVPSSP